MNTPKEDGGPAFPMTGMTQRNGQPFQAVFHEGLALRDYFAAQALNALIQGDVNRSGSFHAEEGIENAYKIADAMLKERAK